MGKKMLDLDQDRITRNQQLYVWIAETAAKRHMLPDQIIELILNDVLGNQLVDDELEENLVIALADTFDIATVNPQHEVNDDGEEEDEEEIGGTLHEIDYKCPKCNYEWQETYQSVCDSECPECGTKSITPISSREIKDLEDEEDTASLECYYHDHNVCGGEIWVCQTCEESYCTNHNHRTDKGENVECVACERERKDKAD